MDFTLNCYRKWKKIFEWFAPLHFMFFLIVFQFSWSASMDSAKRALFMRKQSTKFFRWWDLGSNKKHWMPSFRRLMKMVRPFSLYLFNHFNWYWNIEKVIFSDLWSIYFCSVLKNWASRGGLKSCNCSLWAPLTLYQILSYINIMYLKRSHFLCR